MTELRQAEAYARYMRGIGWFAERKDKKSPYIYGRGLIPPTTVMKMQRADYGSIDFDWLKQLSRERKTLMAYMELSERLLVSVGAEYKLKRPAKKVRNAFVESIKKMRRHGWHPVKSGMLPTKTQRLDLRLSKEALRQGMKAKTRYNLGLAERRGLRTEVVPGTKLLNDAELLERFYTLIKQNAQRVGYWTIAKHWLVSKLKGFGDDAFAVLVTGKDEDELETGALFLMTKTTCFYSVNGSSQTGRHNMAPTLAIWAGVKEAKKRKLTELDFDGVYDERLPNKRWLGYTRFKAGFGGDYIYYPPAFMKWLPGR